MGGQSFIEIEGVVKEYKYRFSNIIFYQEPEKSLSEGLKIIPGDLNSGLVEDLVVDVDEGRERCRTGIGTKWWSDVLSNDDNLYDINVNNDDEVVRSLIQESKSSVDIESGGIFVDIGLGGQSFDKSRPSGVGGQSFEEGGPSGVGETSFEEEPYDDIDAAHVVSEDDVDHPPAMPQQHRSIVDSHLPRVVQLLALLLGAGDYHNSYQSSHQTGLYHQGKKNRRRKGLELRFSIKSLQMCGSQVGCSSRPPIVIDLIAPESGPGVRCSWGPLGIGGVQFRVSDHPTGYGLREKGKAPT
ncbi:hypothetical protein CJ030_MR4G018567 [Morella rubra]|uniref:Uncharacterized protein n=1 Tax=Morella rubra TaxID=262757 RepID=A0A6A1VU45_9ROSI|nr:hypothetical protein CJ030_MR4G018567 [Morella rubra]